MGDGLSNIVITLLTDPLFFPLSKISGVGHMTIISMPLIIEVIAVFTSFLVVVVYMGHLQLMRFVFA